MSVFLLQDELDKIAKRNFSIERLSQVRDIFLFCCYTGLAYADVKKLKMDQIQKGVDGKVWIIRPAKDRRPVGDPIAAGSRTAFK